MNHSIEANYLTYTDGRASIAILIKSITDIFVILAANIAIHRGANRAQSDQ